MNEITILHLSDIHFRRKDKEPLKTYRQDVRAKMLAAIQTHLDNEKTAPDFVAVTGDIAYSGKKEEYDEAGEFFKELKGILPGETVFLVVPGNHDVDRKKINDNFPLHDIVNNTKRMDKFLESKKDMNNFVHPKFKAFRTFANTLNLDLYPKKGDYFWVMDYKDKNVSFLGLNSCWACEKEADKNHISLGYPQVINAYKQAQPLPNRILLLHHPFNWLKEEDLDRYRGEIFKGCGLILHGHNHSDNALAIKYPSGSSICLCTNASYTTNEKGFIGFQFIRASFKEKGLTVTVWPYRLDERDLKRFVPDIHRYEGQNGQTYFTMDIGKTVLLKNNNNGPNPEEKEIFDFEHKNCLGASMGDIDPAKIREVIEQMDERRSMETFGMSFSKNINPVDFFKETKLGQENTLTNAAILLYGKFPQKLQGLQSCSIFCTRFKGSSEFDEVLDEIIATGALSNQIHSSIDFIKRNIRRGWFLSNKVERSESYEYPIDAIREAIVNAVAHRDYDLEARCQVRVFDDRIEIWSPGNLVEKLSIDDLYKSHNSYPRNKVIASHLYAFLQMEERGIGTVKIVRRMKETGLPEPKFENVGYDFVVKLLGPGSGFQEKKKVLPFEIPEDYREWVLRFHSKMDTVQLDPNGKALHVPLPEVYIPIETANPFYKPNESRLMEADGKDEAKGAEKDDKQKEPQFIDIEKLLGRKNCVLLQGPAGMGKTTLIKHLAYTITQGVGEVSLGGYLPVVVLLKDLWPLYDIHEKKLKGVGAAPTFQTLLASYLEKHVTGLTPEVVEQYCSRERTLFLIDGLDEVPAHLRGNIVEMISMFRLKNENNRFLLTGRPHGIDARIREHFGADFHRIEPLDEAKVKVFIKKWFSIVSGQAAGLAEAMAGDMIGEIRGNEYIAVFSGNPLLLTAVCILYQDNKRLPDQRADLYYRIVANLLYRRFHHLPPEQSAGIEQYLKLLAFRMQERNLKKIDVSEVREMLKEIFQASKVPHSYKGDIQAFFEEIESHCGLLKRSGEGEIEFFHLTFQEFLAARHLQYTEIDYKQYFEKPWWEETILLYIGLIEREYKDKANRLTDEILNYSHKDECCLRRLWLLGAKALRDLQAFKRDNAILDKAREKLLTIIESGESTYLEERFEAGEILGQLGDPRIDVLNPSMVFVKGGIFARGANESDDEKPVRQIHLDEFMIGKYPVTNQEFRAFMEDKGYETKDYWTPEGWQWRQKKNISEPWYWHDRTWNCPNFPVVGVSWYEAAAYAAWLSKKTGNRYCLPKEAQWEKAARGSDGLIYPWGDRFDKNKCNSYECGLRRTSPVGLFPLGKSPCGCMDMAGNMWEWCADWYEGDYYKESPSKNPPGPARGLNYVLRGGGWINGDWSCRAAYRYDAPPAARDDDVGFRLSRSL